MARHGAECQDCRYFVHAKLPSGRITRRRSGECTYVVKWPTALPMNYNWPQSKPVPTKVWADSNAEGCECFYASV